MVFQGTYFSPININSHFSVLQKKTNNTSVSLNTIINGNVNVICYDSKDFVLPYLRSISQNDYSALPPLHVPTEEHDNITDENNRR